MSETNEDWRDEMLVMTHEVMPREDATAPRALRTVTLKPTPALELNDIYSDEGDGWAFLRAHIKGVALHGGEGTAFVGGLRYHVRRATRAERLGQEDREHEEDEGLGRSSSDAYDEENLREQLAEALDMLAEAAAPGGIGPHEFSRPGGYRARVIAILAKHGRN